jgi:hypothetical protein
MNGHETIVRLAPIFALYIAAVTNLCFTELFIEELFYQINVSSFRVGKLVGCRRFYEQTTNVFDYPCSSLKKLVFRSEYEI